MSSFAINALISRANEGNSGATLFTYTVTRVGGLAYAAAVDWVVAGQGVSPANANDFVGAVLPSGTLTFIPNQAVATITVPVQGDRLVEPDENFTVTLSNPRTIGSIIIPTAAGTILNDDTTPLSGLSADFYDDFTNSSALDGRTGWAWTPTASAAAKVALKASGGAAQYIGASSGTTDFVGHDVGSGGLGQFIEFTSGLTAGQVNYLVMRGVDKASNITVTTGPGGGLILRYMGFNVAGRSASYSAPSPDLGKYRVEIYNDNTFSIFRNGDNFIQGGVGALDNTTDPIPTGTLCGISNYQTTTGVRIAEDFRCGTVNVTVKNTLSFYPADATGHASVAINGAFAGALSSLNYELRNMASDTVVQSIGPVGSFVLGAGTYSGTVSVPQGGPYRARVTYDNDPAIYGYSRKISVGHAHLVWGQSEVGAYSSLMGSDPAAGDPNVNTWLQQGSNSGWVRDDSNVYFINNPATTAIAAKMIHDVVGIPQGMWSNGVAARFLQSLTPGDPNGENLWQTYFLDNLTAAGINTFHSILLEQGVAESWQAAAQASRWHLDFDNFRSSARAVAGKPNLPVGVCLVQQRSVSLNNGNASLDNPVSANANLVHEVIHTNHDPVGSNTFVSHHCLGTVKLAGDEHIDPQAAAGGHELNRRWAFSVLRWVYGTQNWDGRGPLPGIPTRTGATIDIPLTLNGAAAVTGSALTGFIVGTTSASLIDSTQPSPLAITSVNVVNPGPGDYRIRIVLAADPGGPVWVASHRGYIRSDSSMAVGTGYPDGGSIPVYPLTKPVQTSS